MKSNTTFASAYAARKNDWSISSYYTHLEPEIEKFKVTCTGGYNVSVHQTYKEAAFALIQLIKDPWYYDRKEIVKLSV
jgi:hypothetical protein